MHNGESNKTQIPVVETSNRLHEIWLENLNMQIQEQRSGSWSGIHLVREQVRHLAVTLCLWMKDDSDQRDTGTVGGNKEEEGIMHSWMFL